RRSELHRHRVDDFDVDPVGLRVGEHVGTQCRVEAEVVTLHHQREPQRGTRTVALHLRQRLVHHVDVYRCFDVDVDVCDMKGVDDLFVRGGELRLRTAHVLQVWPDGAAEGDRHVAAHALDGVDVIDDARLVQRDGAAPGRHAARRGADDEGGGEEPVPGGAG